MFPVLGTGWSVDGRPLVAADVDAMPGRTAAELQALDLVDTDIRTWSAGPSACTLSPRATALVAAWSREAGR